MTVERWLRIIVLRARSLFLRSRVEADLHDELRFHIDERARQLVERGMPPHAARDAAMRAFGGVEQRKEECRDARHVGWLEDAVRDVAFAFRMMRRSPGFTAVAVLSLSLGIGANTAMFTVVDMLVLRKLPVRDADRLVLLQTDAGFLSVKHFEHLRAAW